LPITPYGIQPVRREIFLAETTRTFSRGNVRKAAALWALTVLVLSGCEGFPSSQSSGKQSRQEQGQDYAAALAVANRYFAAWQNHNAPAARSELSDRLASWFAQTDEQMLNWPRNPRHEAYEISGGKEKGEGQFTFQVRLFYRFLGQADDRLETDGGEVAVIRDEQGRWRIDQLPTR